MRPSARVEWMPPAKPRKPREVAIGRHPFAARLDGQSRKVCIGDEIPLGTTSSPSTVSRWDTRNRSVRVSRPEAVRAAPGSSSRTWWCIRPRSCPPDRSERTRSRSTEPGLAADGRPSLDLWSVLARNCCPGQHASAHAGLAVSGLRGPSGVAAGRACRRPGSGGTTTRRRRGSRSVGTACQSGSARASPLGPAGAGRGGGGCAGP
jgi:hypothetical protein